MRLASNGFTFTKLLCPFTIQQTHVLDPSPILMSPIHTYPFKLLNFSTN